MQTLINGANPVVQSTKNVIFPNNFTALHNYISKVTTGDKIGKFVATYNFPSLTKQCIFYPRNIFGLGVFWTFISKIRGETWSTFVTIVSLHVKCFMLKCFIIHKMNWNILVQKCHQYMGYQHILSSNLERFLNYRKTSSAILF